MDDKQILNTLHFGFVDSESEHDLDKKFIKTRDFETFFGNHISLVLGVKGSGKSALFEMFTKFEEHTRRLANGKLDDVFIVRGTGFNDLTEISSGDMETLMAEERINYQKLWELYIAIKVAIKLGEENYRSAGPFNEMLKQLGEIEDYRILPILKSLWGLIIGKPPNSFEIGSKVVNLKFGDKSKSLDVYDVLVEVNTLLEHENKEVWVLFDKIDELYSDDIAKRKLAIEGLFRAYSSMKNKYPQIKFKILLRTDIWSELEIVNKSHLTDKTLELKWNPDNLIELLNHRACISNDVRKYISRKLNIAEENVLNEENRESVFYSLFEKQIYKGKRESGTIKWLMERMKDGAGNVYPREVITFSNKSVEHQESRQSLEDAIPINGNSMLLAFSDASKIKCDTYFAEFPHLKKHFDLFDGLTTAKFERGDLLKRISSLFPSGEEGLKQLYNVGILAPRGKKQFSNAQEFEIPRLYRSGMGLVVRGRP